MKKFLFVVSFVVLSQVTLAEEANSSHANTNATQPATASSTAAPQQPAAVEKKSKLFEYVSACLAGREIPAASAFSGEVSKQ